MDLSGFEAHKPLPWGSLRRERLRKALWRGERESGDEKGGQARRPRRGRAGNGEERREEKLKKDKKGGKGGKDERGRKGRRRLKREEREKRAGRQKSMEIEPYARR